MTPEQVCLKSNRRRAMRAATQATREGAPTGRIRLFRLTHVIVVLTNVLQLLFMITFLVLLLLQLNEDIAVSWVAVFTPLWMSDAITTITGIQEMRRLCAPGESRRCNPPPAWQLNRPPPPEPPGCDGRARVRREGCGRPAPRPTLRCRPAAPPAQPTPPQTNHLHVL